MNVLVVCNQAAGQGDAGLFSYVRALLDERCEVSMRALSPESSLELVLRDVQDFDRVVAAGGDGTISSVAYALRDSGVPMLAYPAGTGNLIALNLKMPLTPAELASVTLRGKTLATDLGEVTCQTRSGAERTAGFVTAAGAGFDARVIEGAQDLKPMLGFGAYFVSAMRVLQPTVATITLELDGETVQTDGIAAMLVNFSKMLFDLSLTHDSSAHDGALEVVVIRTRFVAGLVPAIWAALLDRITDDHPGRSASLEIHRASSVRVSTSPALPMQYDGEMLDATTPFTGRVLPKAATFVVPSD